MLTMSMVRHSAIPTDCQPSFSKSATAPRRFLRHDSLGKTRHRRAPSANF